MAAVGKTCGVAAQVGGRRRGSAQAARRRKAREREMRVELSVLNAGVQELMRSRDQREVAPRHFSHYGCSDPEEEEEDSDLDWTWSEDEEPSEQDRSLEMVDTRDLSVAWQHLISMPLSLEESRAVRAVKAENSAGNDSDGCRRINPGHKSDEGGALEASLRGSCAKNTHSSSIESDFTEWETAQSCSSEGETPFFEGTHTTKTGGSHSKEVCKSRVLKGEVPVCEKNVIPIHIQLESELLCLREGGLMKVDIPGICLPSEHTTQPTAMADSISAHAHDSYSVRSEISFAGRNRMFFISNGTRKQESETQKIQSITKRASLAGGWKRMKRELRSWILPQCLYPSDACMLTSKSQGRHPGCNPQNMKKNSTVAFNSTKSLKGYCRRQQYLVDRIEQSIA